MLRLSWPRRVPPFVFLAAVLVGCGGEDESRDRLPADGGSDLLDTGAPLPHDAAFDVAQDAAVDCRIADERGGICACTEVSQSPTTLYLLLDRSGSMTEIVKGTGRSRWGLVRSALLDPKDGVLRKLGGRIAVAAAWFPSPSQSDVCNSGRQVFPLTRGSPQVYDALEAKLASAIPRGQTPTAASLREVARALAKAPRPAHVILATDGGPNCGAGPCDAAHCSYNIEGDQVVIGATCDASFNCCDPARVNSGLGWKACLDDEASADAAAALAAEGIKVFVLGVPGTPAAYATSLDAIAVAGGAPREGAGHAYYSAAAPTREALVEALDAIAAKAVDSCTIRLESAVEDPGVTNVLLDGVPIAPEDGWRWASPSSVELTGGACERVRDGQVARVQVVVGCRTVTR